MGDWLVKSKENCKERRNSKYKEQPLYRKTELKHPRENPSKRDEIQTLQERAQLWFTG